MSSDAAVKIGQKFGKICVQQVRKLSWWGVPAAAIAGWMIFPALTPSFKKEIGL